MKNLRIEDEEEGQAPERAPMPSRTGKGDNPTKPPSQA